MLENKKSRSVQFDGWDVSHELDNSRSPTPMKAHMHVQTLRLKTLKPTRRREEMRDWKTLKTDLSQVVRGKDIALIAHSPSPVHAVAWVRYSEGFSSLSYAFYCSLFFSRFFLVHIYKYCVCIFSKIYNKHHKSINFLFLLRFFFSKIRFKAIAH